MDQRTIDRHTAASRLERLRRERDGLREEGGRRSAHQAEGITHALRLLEGLDVAALLEAVGDSRRARLAAAAELEGRSLQTWAIEALEAAAAPVLDAAAQRGLVSRRTGGQ